MRVIYPFIVWCIVYALYYVFKNGDSWQDFFVNILHIPVNFGTEVGHLWFIYMILDGLNKAPRNRYRDICVYGD